MFMDTEGHGGEPPEPVCCSACKEPIAPHEKRVIITDTVVDGIYHEICAKPLLSVLNALTALSRMHGG